MALEQYYADYGVYPDTGGVQVCLGIPATETCWGGATGNAALNAALAPYISAIPKDPSYGDSGRIYNAYVYRSPGKYSMTNPTTDVITTTLTGAYNLAFMPDVVSGRPSCGGWTYGVWDSSPGTTHCPTGGSCRQCGYLKQE